MEDLMLINQLTPSEAYQFLHDVVDEFCGIPGTPDSNKDEHRKMREAWLAFLPKLSISGRTKQPELNGLSEEIQKTLNECMETRRNDIRTALLNLIPMTDNTRGSLKNFDWQVKQVLASDSMSQINEPLLKLDLTLASSKTGKSLRDLNERVISIELTKDELKSFIQSLQEAAEAFR